MSKKKFEVIYKQGALSTYKILIDNVTGVNYILVSEGHGGGITPLLDKDGKVVVSDIGRKEY